MVEACLLVPVCSRVWCSRRIERASVSTPSPSADVRLLWTANGPLASLQAAEEDANKTDAPPFFIPLSRRARGILCKFPSPSRHRSQGPLWLLWPSSHTLGWLGCDRDDQPSWPLSSPAAIPPRGPCREPCPPCLVRIMAPQTDHLPSVFHSSSAKSERQPAGPALPAAARHQRGEAEILLRCPSETKMRALKNKCENCQQLARRAAKQFCTTL